MSHLFKVSSFKYVRSLECLGFLLGEREREGGSNFVCEHDTLTNANFMFTI